MPQKETGQGADPAGEKLLSNSKTSSTESNTQTQELSSLVLPKRPRGRPSQKSSIEYSLAVKRFCGDILEIASRLDFAVSSRGWCYILEDTYGLPKGDFNTAQTLINDCRKSGDLPLEICAEDSARSADNIERLDSADPEEYAADIISYLDDAHEHYLPFAIWDNLDFYVEMVVEKIDLKSLFSSVCRNYGVPLSNARGWADLNSRAAIMRRFAHWEQKGKQCVLLYCGDHDPGGLAISEFLRSNFEDMAGAVGWTPENLIIERFGLNYDFIEEQGLSWIENLETSGGGRLDDANHPDHKKPYVQEYLRRFGARKVEANALIVRPDAGRQICRDAIRQYVSEGDVDAYKAKLEDAREQIRIEILRQRRDAA